MLKFLVRVRAKLLSIFLKSGPSCPINPPKFKFFIYCMILLKFEIQYFHIFTNNNGDKNLWIEAPLPPQGPPPPHFSKKAKFFIYCAILIQFETQDFHMFTKNIRDRNLWMEALLSPGVPSSPPLKKVKFFIYILCNFYEIWNIIFSFVYQ